MNIKLDTLIFTLVSAMAAVIAASCTTKYPDVAFWANVITGCTNAALLVIKQSSPPF